MQKHKKLFYTLQALITGWLLYSMYRITKLADTEYWVSITPKNEIHQLVIINTMISTLCLVIIAYFVMSKINETIAENMKQIQK